MVRALVQEFGKAAQPQSPLKLFLNWKGTVGVPRPNPRGIQQDHHPPSGSWGPCQSLQSLFSHRGQNPRCKLGAVRESQLSNNPEVGQLEQFPAINII